MKIGFFTDTFLPQINGVATALNDFGKELSARGHTVHVFCPSSYGNEEYKINGMQVHAFKSVKFKPYPDYRIGLPVSLKRVPALDIVHTHGPFGFGWYGLRAARNQKLPCIGTFHTLISEFSQYLKIPPKLYRGFSWSYLRMHYKKYDLLTTPSKAIRGVLEEHKFAPPITVLPNGVDTQFFRPAKNARKSLGIDADRVYLYLGRLSHEKHVDIVIQTAKNFLQKNDVLVIAGKGPSENSLRELAKGDKRIRFTGFVEQEALPLYYSAADAFITASTCETQGLTLLEAMACGCPVIGRDVLATNEVVENGKNGYLWKSQSELVDIISRLGRKKISQLSKNAQKTAKEYSIPQCTDRLEQIYKGMLS